MARCGCDSPDSCQCSAEAGPLGELTVAGTGTVADPFVVDNPAYQIVADIAARDAIASPQEGWIAYVLTTGLLYFYDGTQWVAVSYQEIDTQEAASAVSSLSFTVDPDDFRIWRMLIEGGHNDSGTWRTVLARVNGLATGYRTAMTWRDGAGTAFDASAADTTAFFVGRWATTGSQSQVIDFILSANILIAQGQSFGYDAGGNNDPGQAWGGGRITGVTPSSLAVLVSGANLETGTQVTLYGSSGVR